jgi:hypothetical protein
MFPTNFFFTAEIKTVAKGYLGLRNRKFGLVGKQKET